MSPRGKLLLEFALAMLLLAGAWRLGAGLRCLPETKGALPMFWVPPGRPPPDPACYSIELTHEYRTYNLPDPENLRRFSLGYSKMLGDFFLVGVIGNTDWSEKTPGFLNWVYQMGLAISALHPKYAFSYYAIGTFLSFQKDYLHLSNAIFERGSKELPDDFNMPFYIAYNYYWQMNDPKGALPYFAEACRRPGAPPHMCTMAGKLAVSQEADVLEIARMIAQGYCINADRLRATIIRADFEQRVLPKVADLAQRERLKTAFERNIEACQRAQEKE